MIFKFISKSTTLRTNKLHDKECSKKYLYMFYQQKFYRLKLYHKSSKHLYYRPDTTTSRAR